MNKLQSSLLLLALLLLAGCKDTARNTGGDRLNSGTLSGTNSVYYLIRHAEKDRSNPSEEDPDLTARGHRRAALWSRYFDTISLDAVYSTNYKRTRQTAAPTAASKNLPVEFYDPSKLYDAAFQEATDSKKVLIVGHSNTTPAFVNRILGQNRYSDMDDAINSTLYIVRQNPDGVRVKVETVPLN